MKCKRGASAFIVVIAVVLIVLVLVGITAKVIISFSESHKKPIIKRVGVCVINGIPFEDCNIYDTIKLLKCAEKCKGMNSAYYKYKLSFFGTIAECYCKDNLNQTKKTTEWE